MMNVNVRGAFRVLGCIIPEFRKRKEGHIVLIGSIAGYRGLPNSLGYGASKAALIHLAENLKSELLDDNIKVQVINPGFVKTRLTDQNTFFMPSLMTPEKAAVSITKAMEGNPFESHFPFLFANVLRWIGRLPYGLYFRLVKFLIISQGTRLHKRKDLP
jgi:short-subunit dehydrogenase